MSRTNAEEQEMIYMMPNGRPVVVRNQGQSHQETRNRKTNKLCWSMITVAIIIALTMVFRAINNSKGTSYSSSLPSSCKKYDTNIDCCTINNKCDMEEGNCYNDGQCKHGLKCGKNNCPKGFPKSYGCCYKPVNCGNGTMAKSCKDCGSGSNYTSSRMCNGECYWDSSIEECQIICKCVFGYTYMNTL